MNRLVETGVMVPLIAFGMSAQSTQEQLDVVKKHLAAESEMLKMNVVGSVKGAVVKGMPYSADETTEITQVLGDGTRIHRETKTSVYRDSEGRTRRETPESVMINDPVANMTYIVNPKTNAVKKLQMASTLIYRREGTAGGTLSAAGPTTFSMRTNGEGPTEIIVNGQPLDPAQVKEMVDKAKAEGKAEFKSEIDGNVVYWSNGAVRAGTPAGAMAAPKQRRLAAGKTESLGQQSMEGVLATGTRTTETIETGEIGNDRPIQIVNERWFSEELGMPIMTKRTDPRTGEETFRVTNIRRGDPAPYLFQPPAGSTMNETKM